MCPSNEIEAEDAALNGDIDLFYQTLFNNNPEMVFFLDWEGVIAKANTVTIEKLRFSMKELELHPLEDFLPSDHIGKYKVVFQQALSGRSINIETEFLRKNGDILNIYLSMVPAKNDGRVVGVFIIAQDVTEQRKIEKEYLETELKFRSIVEQALFGFFIIQHEKIIYTNTYFRELVAIDKSIHDQNLWELLHDDNKIKLKSMIERLVAGREAMIQYLQLYDANGNKLHLEVHAVRLIYQNEWTIIGTLHDVTQRKRTEALNKYITNHDYLTGLPNRQAYDKKIEAEIRERKDSGRQLAILYLDLDRFKYINDSLGHLLGDAFIKQVTIRIQQSLTDRMYIARMNGGDEFAVLIPDLEDKQEAAGYAKQILKALQKSFIVDSYQLAITTSIGISIFPEDAEDAETMMMHAHSALRDAKKKGKNIYRFYESNMHPEAYNTLVLENDLRNAIDRGQLELYFQPKVGTEGNNIVGAEALIRWNHPEWGLLSPGVFIPLAEETGIITEIEKWVEFMACKQNKAWQDDGLPAIPISINLTANRFLDSKMVKNIKQVLKETKLDPSCLEIEFTESTLLKSEHEMNVILDELRSLGVRISLDDFGTGYSSLSYLNRFRGRIDTLKLDRSFISELSFADEAESNYITKTIIDLAQHLKMSVVAEGVETEEQLQVLTDYNCETIQGFLFSRPVPAEDFAVLLARGTIGK